MSRPSWDVFVIDGTTNEPVKAVLYEGVLDHNLDHHKLIWAPRLQKHNETLLRLQVKDGFAEDAKWDWARKAFCTAGQMGYRHYALEVNGQTEGLMMIKLITATSRIEPPKDLVYISFLSTGPENRKNIKKPPQYKGIGSILFNTAIQVSMNEDMDGKIGLHSLPGAQSFYTDLGMKDFGPDKDVENLNYYELPSSEAKRLLEEMND